MKKYIFLTGSICNMGGAEQYINKKIQRLKNSGFDAYVFSSRRGNVIIDTLKEYEKLRFYQLGLPPYVFSKKFVNKTIEKICSAIDYSSTDLVHIESTEYGMAQWGEILAEKISAKHVCIILQEQHSYPSYVQDFLYFKYIRKELYGINENSVAQMLPNYEIINNYYIDAECNNVVDDVPNNCIKELPLSNWNICSIGRLDKNYVLNGVNEIVTFANSHSNMKINLILVGGGSDGAIELINKSISRAVNVKTFITGYLFPIPLDLIMQMDCFFGSAGSSRIPVRYNKPSISYSAEGECLGILNYTTTQTLYKKEGDEKIEMSSLLEEILINNYCATHQTLGMEREFTDYQKEFERQLSFFDNSNHDNSYYNFEHKVIMTNKEKVYKFLSFVMGGSLFERFQNYLHSMKGEGIK